MLVLASRTRSVTQIGRSGAKHAPGSFGPFDHSYCRMGAVGIVTRDVVMGGALSSTATGQRRASDSWSLVDKRLRTTCRKAATPRVRDPKVGRTAGVSHRCDRSTRRFGVIEAPRSRSAPPGGSFRAVPTIPEAAPVCVTRNRRLRR
jgi:hypothetical protein